MGKNLDNRKGTSVSMKFFIHAEDILELNPEVEDEDFVEESVDFEYYEYEYEYEYESYQINDYITLKFEDGFTQIYINGEAFMHCIRLILHIPYSEVEKYDEINSIDDAIDIYRKSLYQNNIVEGPGARIVHGFTHDIQPEEEFRGHCSNIQAWAENDYNTCILHSNLAFPLLKRLTEVGDPKARKVFKDEIAKRYEMGDERFRYHLEEMGYLKYLTEEELWTLKRVSREMYNDKKNRYVKNRDNSATSNAIFNFVTYYIASRQAYEENDRRSFLESCNQTLIKTFRYLSMKSITPQSVKDIRNHVIKRKLLYRELEQVKSEFQITGKLRGFLKSLEVSIKYSDPDFLEKILNSFMMEP